MARRISTDRCSFRGSSDSARKYPIVDSVYPGPQSGSAGSRAFNASSGADLQALAELGFVVVASRSEWGRNYDRRAFRTFSYGHMGMQRFPTRWPESADSGNGIGGSISIA